jgi:hypothetical protein
MNEFITYGIFVIYNLILIGGTFFAIKKYNDIVYKLNLIKEEQVMSGSYINEYLAKQKNLINSVNGDNGIAETVKKLDTFYINYDMDEFGDRLKWMEKIVEGLDGIDAESKIQEHDELLDQLDIRDINDTISNLASEEYVNQEIEDLHTYINEQCERIDYLEQIFGGFKNILNEKEEF